jgi:hypothetical protein
VDSAAELVHGTVQRLIMAGPKSPTVGFLLLSLKSQLLNGLLLLAADGHLWTAKWWSEGMPGPSSPRAENGANRFHSKMTLPEALLGKSSDVTKNDRDAYSIHSDWTDDGPC